MYSQRANGTPAPARVTRSRASRSATPAAQPLPAVQTAQSFSYGAPGKADLGKQVTSSAAEMDAAFTHQTREETPVMPPPPPPQSRPMLRPRAEKAQYPQKSQLPQDHLHETRSGYAHETASNATDRSQVLRNNIHETRSGHPHQTAGDATEKSPSSGNHLRERRSENTHNSAGNATDDRPGTEIQDSAFYDRKTILAPVLASGPTSPSLGYALLHNLIGALALLGLAISLGSLLAFGPLPSSMVSFQERLLHGSRTIVGLSGPAVWNATSVNGSHPVRQAYFNYWMKQEVDRQSMEIDRLSTEVESHGHRISSLEKRLQYDQPAAPIGTELLAQLEILFGNLRQVNYFSPGMRASIDPHTTSHWLGQPAGWLGKLRWAAGFAKVTLPEYAHPPIAALMDWTESGQCWCAKGTAAQFGVKLGHQVFPDKAILEHIPADGTLNIHAAPRNLEFWAEMESANDVQRVKQLLDMRVHIAQAFECGNPPTDQQNWICLGTGQYDIHHPLWAQEFELHGNWEGIEVSTNRMVVRVTENWGADHTCIYRVRLIGSQAAQVVEVEEEL